MGGAQPQLNGAYYGPSIPPPKSHSYHRPGRGGDCDDCCCGLFCFLFKLLVTIIIILGIAVFVFWLVVRPNMLKFHVIDASLTQFNYTNNTLFHNLALNITIRNPNRKIGIYYDRIEARALYQDARFDSVTITPFYQGHKTTYVVSPVFSGQTLLLLASQQTSELNKDKSSGIYSIDVNLHLKVRFKLGALKTFKFKPKVNCDLKIPLTAHETSSSAGGFQTTKCDLDY